MQVAPWLHAPQKPPLQTPPGQAVPFGLAVPSTQTPEPLLQSMLPRRQAALAFMVHDAPGVHGLHAPALQTPPEQVVPFGFGPPSVHTALPLAQLMTPFRQAAPGLVVQVAPSLQGLQVPFRQAPPGQAVPFDFELPSTQTAAPELHSMVPLRQALPGLVVHVAP